MEKITLPRSSSYKHNNIVISSKITLHRNIDGLPYPHKMENSQIQSVTNSIIDLFHVQENIHCMDISSFSNIEQQTLLNDLVITPCFLEHSGSTFIAKKDGSWILLPNERSHITLFSIEFGLNLKTSFHQLQELILSVEDKIHFSFHPEFGFLTPCLELTGNGLAVSVLLNLSGLELLGEIPELQVLCEEFHFSLNPIIPTFNCKLFYIKNLRSFGTSELEQFELIHSFINKLIKLEQDSRIKCLSKQEDIDFFATQILQLTNKKSLNYEECLEFISIVSMLEGIIYKISDKELWFEQIFRLKENNHLFQNISNEEQDSYRSKLLLQVFSNIVKLK